MITRRTLIGLALGVALALGLILSHQWPNGHPGRGHHVLHAATPFTNSAITSFSPATTGPAQAIRGFSRSATALTSRSEMRTTPKFGSTSGPSHVLNEMRVGAYGNYGVDVPVSFIVGHATQLYQSSGGTTLGLQFKKTGGLYAFGYVDPNLVYGCPEPQGSGACTSPGVLQGVATESEFYHACSNVVSGCGGNGTISPSTRLFQPGSPPNVNFMNQGDPFAQDQFLNYTRSQAAKDNNLLDFNLCDDVSDLFIPGGGVNNGGPTQNLPPWWNAGNVPLEEISNAGYRAHVDAMINNGYIPCLTNGSGGDVGGGSWFLGQHFTDPKVWGANHESVFLGDGCDFDDHSCRESLEFPTGGHVANRWDAQAGRVLADNSNIEADHSTGPHGQRFERVEAIPRNVSRGARMYYLASYWLVADVGASGSPQGLGWDIYTIDGKITNTDPGGNVVTLVPEMGIVATGPLTSATGHDIYTLRLNETTAFLREFATCYLNGRLQGQCAVVVNPHSSSSLTTLSMPIFAQTYTRQLRLDDDCNWYSCTTQLSGGTVTIINGIPSSTVPPLTGYMLFQ